MLALLGLLGAVVAGIAADAVLARPEEEIEGEEAEGTLPGSGAEAPPEPEGDPPGDLLDWPDPQLAPEGDGAADGPASSDTPADPPEDMVLTGGAGVDGLYAEGGQDTVTGLGGGDHLMGRGGDDLLDGGTGDDHAWGGAGDDTMLGDDGRDVLQGEEGDDKLDGGAGDDVLAGHEGDDLLAGGDGQDTLAGGAGTDALAGGAGDDWLAGGFGDDSLQGGTGADTLDGNDGHDSIWGNDDDEADFLNGGAGDDWLGLGQGDQAHGGEGADTFAIDGWIGAGEIAQISDYAPGEDEIVVVYDPATHPDPQLSVVSAPGSADATVLLDGMPVAHVAGGAGMDAGALRLVASDQLAA
ncbi:MAG: calcium-binding protein [Gemmobacter sp.]